MGSESPPEIGAALQRALDSHQRGHLAEAEHLYSEVLARSPAHPAALQFLGVLRHQRGDNESAVQLLHKSLNSAPTNPFAHSNLAAVFIALGRFEAALEHLDRALALKPDYAEALSNRGTVLMELKRFREALASYDRALATKPDFRDAWYNRGTTLNALGRHEDAVAAFDRALALASDSPKIHYNRGNSLSAVGRYEDAVMSYDRALAASSDHIDARCNRAYALGQSGRLADAAAAYLEALRIAPEHSETRIGAADFLRYATEIDAAWEPFILSGLSDEDLDPQAFEPVAAKLICRAPALKALLDVANEDGADPDALAHRLRRALEAGEFDDVLRLPLLLAVLAQCLITRFALERALTLLRHALLLKACGGTANDPAVDRFASHLALQCFATEYAYMESEAERRLVAELTERASAELKRNACPILFPAVLAAYRPLFKLPFAADLVRLSAASPDSGFEEVVRRQIREPLREVEVRSMIPHLTSVEDAVSNAVRRQYEDNPYPRWRRRTKAGSQEPLHGPLQAQFPQKAIPASSPKRLDILVAGCGTGSQPIQVSRRFPSARILAVDLSLTSLAYAKRMTEERGIAAIEYGCADILNLGSLRRQFDLIDSTGVLHHLRDPLEGWRVLAELLRADGYMKIGLYSRRARRGLEPVRRFIADRGLSATPEGIRAARRLILSGASGLPDRFEGIDFASVSACRDLLFHAQEHLFSPLAIGDCLDRLNLEFLGFQFADPRPQFAYRQRFPNDPACDSLANWERFEEEHPDTFIGMYQFWVRKRNGR